MAFMEVHIVADVGGGRLLDDDEKGPGREPGAFVLLPSLDGSVCSGPDRLRPAGPEDDVTQ
jgi:hypothetical protein